MAIVILLGLVLLILGTASLLLRNHIAQWMPGPIPDNVIHIEDWQAALEQRRLRTALPWVVDEAISRRTTG